MKKPPSQRRERQGLTDAASKAQVERHVEALRVSHRELVKRGHDPEKLILLTRLYAKSPDERPYVIAYDRETLFEDPPVYPKEVQLALTRLIEAPHKPGHFRCAIDIHTGYGQEMLTGWLPYADNDDDDYIVINHHQKRR
jgi:hypothetical protein